MNEPLAIAPRQSSCGTSWWIDAERQGFTVQCCSKFGEFLECDSEQEQQILQRRGDILATLVALRQGRSNASVRRAVILSERN